MRDAVDTETGIALLLQLRGRVVARGNFDGAHDAAAVGMLELDERVGKRRAVDKYMKADVKSLAAARFLRTLRTAGTTPDGLGRGQTAAKLRLETDAHDARTRRNRAGDVGADRIVDVMIVTQLSRVTTGSPVALLAGTARIFRVGRRTLSCQKIATMRREREDVVTALAARNTLLDDDAALLQRGKRPAGGERMTVEAVRDNRLPGNDSEQAESGENGLFTIGTDNPV